MRCEQCDVPGHLTSIKYEFGLYQRHQFQTLTISALSIPLYKSLELVRPLLVLSRRVEKVNSESLYAVGEK